MKSLGFFKPPCRRKYLNLARRIAFPLVLLGAGLALIQPCAGQSGTWTATRSLANAGFNIETATLLPNGKVLVAGSYPVVVDHPYPHVSYVASAELYDPASGTWAVTGIPVTGISSRTATLLPNGKVLVAGASAELYDPASGTWSATGSFGTARDDNTVTLLPNGKVLVAGGISGNGILASADLVSLISLVDRPRLLSQSQPSLPPRSEILDRQAMPRQSTWWRAWAGRESTL